MAIASAPLPGRATCFRTDAINAAEGGDALAGGEDSIVGGGDPLVSGEDSTDDGEDGRGCDGGALDGNVNVVPDGEATAGRTALERS